MRGHHFLAETVYNSSGTRVQFLLSWPVISYIFASVYPGKCYTTVQESLWPSTHTTTHTIHINFLTGLFLNYYLLKLHVSEKLNATKLTSQRCWVLAVEYDSLLFLLIQDYQLFGWRMKAKNKNENKKLPSIVWLYATKLLQANKIDMAITILSGNTFAVSQNNHCP